MVGSLNAVRSWSNKNTIFHQGERRQARTMTVDEVTFFFSNIDTGHLTGSEYHLAQERLSFNMR